MDVTLGVLRAVESVGDSVVSKAGYLAERLVARKVAYLEASWVDMTVVSLVVGLVESRVYA